MPTKKKTSSTAPANAGAEEIASLTLAIPKSVTAEAKARTISGLVLPFNIAAPRTGFGHPVIFKPGSLLAPTDLSRVKLCVDHDHAQPVGYMISLEQRQDGAYATFQLPEGEASDEALAQAKGHLRDGLSVGADIRQGYMSEKGDTYIVAQCVLDEVSLCALPAFSDARVTNITATRKETTMETYTQNTPTAPAPNAGVTAPAPNAGVTATPPATGQTAPVNMTIQAQTVPAAPSFTAPARTAPVTVEQAFAAASHAFQGAISASQVTAALADVTTPNDAGQGLLPPQIVGELWKPRAAARGWISKASTTKVLTSNIVQGFRWKHEGTVSPWPGNKTDIVSTPVETEMITAPVQQYAGGNDVAREYVDLGTGQVLQALFEHYMRSLALQTDAAARDAIITAATVLPPMPGASFADVIVQLGLTSLAVGSSIDYVAISPDMWQTLAVLTKNEVPWWFSSGTEMNFQSAVGNIAFSLFVEPVLPSGVIVAGDKQAHTWYEGPTPRVQAIDVARGGLDIAVYNYGASLVEAPEAIFTIDTSGSIK